MTFFRCEPNNALQDEVQVNIIKGNNCIKSWHEGEPENVMSYFWMLRVLTGQQLAHFGIES